MHGLETMARLNSEQESREHKQEQARENVRVSEPVQSAGSDEEKKNAALSAAYLLSEALETAESNAVWHGGVEYIPRPTGEQVGLKQALDAMRSVESTVGSR